MATRFGSLARDAGGGRQLVCQNVDHGPRRLPGTGRTNSLAIPMKALIDVGGWLGAALLLLAYFLVSAGKVRGSSVRYQGLNIVGSLLLGMNAFYYGAMPSVGIDVAWIGIGVLALTQRRRRLGSLDQSGTSRDRTSD